MIGGARVAVPFVVVALLAAALPGLDAQDLAGDRAALVALRNALDSGNFLPWNTTEPSPCLWRGVVCSNETAPRVIKLRLPGKRLIGTIPPGTVGNLTALQTLSLRHNGITGGIPADIGNCGQLTVVNLTNNQFTGAVPEGFFSLAVLRKADLSRNRLTGGVSPEFNRLKQLDTLFLDSNDLAGALPPGLYLPSLSRFNVSFNAQLTGPVPASLARMPASAFSGTALCDGPLPACPNSAPPAPPPASPSADGGKKKHLSRWAVVGIVAGAALVILLIIGLVACLRRRQSAAAAAAGRPTGAAAANVRQATAPITVTLARTERDAVKQSHAPPLAPAMISEGKKLVFLGTAPERPYDLETLLRASAEVLGKGPLGTTYRATLDGGEPVLAVKRLREVHLSEDEFRHQATALGALHHHNLTRLRAYFYSKEEKLLVYDFVGAGSLSALLHGSCPAIPSTACLLPPRVLLDTWEWDVHILFLASQTQARRAVRGWTSQRARASRWRRRAAWRSSTTPGPGRRTATSSHQTSSSPPRATAPSSPTTAWRGSRVRRRCRRGGAPGTSPRR